jgi:CheY-like chemotaxis protein
MLIAGRQRVHFRPQSRANPSIMTLLFIDDDPDDFIFFKEAVAHCGLPCTCLHADNGLTALTVLDRLRPDIIFLDNNMPLLNGHETLIRIRERRTLDDVPIYMLSTSMTTNECDDFSMLGATGCMVKPDSFQELCELLERTVRSHLHQPE